jgi:alcohol dehydrogenase (NADP+)
MIQSKAYGAKNSFFSHLELIEVERKEPNEHEVQIEVLYCGVCHSDLHQAKNDWGNTIYPCVPGHEIVGKVTSVGSSVTKHQTGDIVGVGCMIDSCKKCEPCKEGEENYCEGTHGFTSTYNGTFKPSGINTFGGYSDTVIVNENFVLKIPANLDIMLAGPILCAGVTTYSPLKHWNVRAGQKIGIIAFGGLGHMATKIAKAMGASVTVFSTHKEKEKFAKSAGADDFVISKDKAMMANLELKFDFILNTIPDKNDINPFVKLLKRNGVLVTVGLLAPYAKPIDNSEVAFHRRTVAGSLIGGIKETQEVLDFCAEHRIYPDVKMIDISEVNDAFSALLKQKEIHHRFVIDMKSLKSEVSS